jgi:hypothetical protein
MSLAMRARVLVLSLLCAACLSQSASAQNSTTSGNIRYEYLPPMSLRYVATAERLKQFRLLEQLSEFFSPIRLPHAFTMQTTECGTVNAFYSPPQRRIVLCYELVESIERVAPKAGEASEYTYQEVVAGALVGVLLHELGHAVFDMSEVPVIGREEDAADAISTFIALQFSKDVARTVIRGYAYLAKVSFGFRSPLYWDEHGTGLQRYYNTLCLAYGGAPEMFGELVAKGDLPRTRAEGCAREYQGVRHAFEKTILPYIDREKMRQVQSKVWLQFTPQQIALLQQQQKQQTQTFTLSVCNLSAFNSVSVAILVRPINDPQKWWSYGWFPVANEGCNVIGSFYGERAYLFAQGRTNDGKVVSWSGSDKNAAKQCIHPQNAFDIAATTKCQPGQIAVDFVRRDLAPDAFGYTWRLSGGK